MSARLWIAWSAYVFLTASAGSDAAESSVAARELERDRVAVLAELVNVGVLGDESPRFESLRGGFHATCAGRELHVEGTFPRATIWRFELASADGAFDMTRLVRVAGATERGPVPTGPWDIFDGEWLVPTARVALDGVHVYTLWFDLPSLADQKAGRVRGSFALELDSAGRHEVTISFVDLQRHTKWRPEGASGPRPAVTSVANPLRPTQIASVAVGEDERVRWLDDVSLRPELVGRHPRLAESRVKLDARVPPVDLDAITAFVTFVDPDRSELWEYCDDDESMASGNDMDTGKKGAGAAIRYDSLVAGLTPRAREALDDAFRRRFEGLYRFFVFQRSYLPTGFAQNHCSATVRALVAAGLVFDGPEAAKWRRMGVMVLRRRALLLGRDGSLESMNEGRSYGLGFWEESRRRVLEVTGLDVAQGPFFVNEARYLLHEGQPKNAPAPPAAPTCVHFADCDQIFVRSDWGQDAWRAHILVGSVFGREGTPLARRYDWAHVQVNRGSFVLSRGELPIVLEPGRTRTYRKSAANDNCVLVNGVDQWGGGQVWHPRLDIDQVGHIAFFADGESMCITRADLAAAYPPQARLVAFSRVLVYVKPDHFLVFDRVVTDGKGRAEWRFHAAFIEPAAEGAVRDFRAFSWRRSAARNPASSDEAFEKLAGASVEVKLLAPRGASATVGRSDVVFRKPFDLPTRHLRVEQEGIGATTLLTAFAPQVRLEEEAPNMFVGEVGSTHVRVLIGPGRAGDMRSDAHLAVAATHQGRTEIYRFGGTRLALGGTAMHVTSDDSFDVQGARDAK